MEKKYIYDTEMNENIYDMEKRRQMIIFKDERPSWKEN